MNKQGSEEDIRNISTGGAFRRDSKIEDQTCLSASETSADSSDNQEQSPRTSDGTPKKAKRTRFPRRLHEMLDGVEKDDKQNIVSWQPDGMSFKVHKTKEFETDIMPKYFNQNKFRSFQRQVRHTCTVVIKVDGFQM